MKELKKAASPINVKGPVLTIVMDGVGPVSYTHLDVYKRQSFLSPIYRRSCATAATRTTLPCCSAAL